MSTLAVDIVVGVAIFALGIAITLRKFARQDYIVLTVAALATPVIAVVAVFYVMYATIVGKKVMTPCPGGLEEAERIVEQRRAQMFGGPIRESSIAYRWRLAYQYELERETEGVRRIARRYLSPA